MDSIDEDITTRERAADMLLMSAFEASPLDVFDKAEEFSADLPDRGERRKLHRMKGGADLLVACRLARYTSEDMTQIELTNAGRYWALSGGFLAFLKEEGPRQTGNGGNGGRGGRGPNLELEEMRMNIMRLRLRTFWWSFGLSLAGFLLSLISLGFILFGRDMIFR